MFDDLQEPKDMFADVPNKTALPTPTPPPGQSSAAPLPASVPVSGGVLEEQPEKTGLGFKLVAMVLVSLVCIGGVGYLVYRIMVRDAVPQEVSDVIGTTPDTTEVPQDTLPDGKGAEEDPMGEPIAVVDSDGDGLTNDEERIAGTSVAKPDTDNDGLGDREEVKVYGTDPKKADTDGDTYTDGEEVQNGYNPLGEGKLLNLPE